MYKKYKWLKNIFHFHYKNGSISISIEEHGIFSSNFESTSGCKTPSLPITSP